MGTDGAELRDVADAGRGARADAWEPRRWPSPPRAPSKRPGVAGAVRLARSLQKLRIPLGSTMRSMLWGGAGVALALTHRRFRTSWPIELLGRHVGAEASARLGAWRKATSRCGLGCPGGTSWRSSGIRSTASQEGWRGDAERPSVPEERDLQGSASSRRCTRAWWWSTETGTSCLVNPALPRDAPPRSGGRGQAPHRDGASRPAAHDAGERARRAGRPPGGAGAAGAEAAANAGAGGPAGGRRGGCSSCSSTSRTYAVSSRFGATSLPTLRTSSGRRSPRFGPPPRRFAVARSTIGMPRRASSTSSSATPFASRTSSRTCWSSPSWSRTSSS